MAGSNLALFISVFLACAVEAVEATTIVLAAGTSRDWKSAWLGTLSGIATLGAVILVLGPNISAIPRSALQLFVGGLLLVFGLQWVRKAILRASGFKALHDEEAIFKKELAAAKLAKADQRFGVADWYAFTLSYKAVLLEGLEVAFIVLTFGTIQHKIVLASIAALAAVVLVVIAGIALKKPLSQVPENTMKFAVGVMLTSFGIFWASEGAGAIWPHGDAALLVIIPAVFLFALALVRLLSNKKVNSGKSESDLSEADDVDAAIILEEKKSKRLIWDFFYFWYDFLIGDDLIGFAIVLIAMESTHILVSAKTNAWWAMPIGVALLLPLNLYRVTAKK